jgi:hypothetical protein
VLEQSKRNARLFSDLYGAWVYEQLERERRYLGKGHNRRIPAVPLRQLQQQVRAITNGSISLGDMSEPQRSELAALGKLQTHLGDAFMAQLGTSSRGSYHKEHHAHRGWQPRHKRKYER